MTQQRIICDHTGCTASIAGHFGALHGEAEEAGWLIVPNGDDRYRAKHYCPAHAGLPEISSLPVTPRV